MEFNKTIGIVGGAPIVFFLITFSLLYRISSVIEGGGRSIINVSIIDLVNNGLHGHWYHKVGVPCNLSLDALLVSIIFLFGLRRIVKKLKCLFQEGV